MSFVCQNADPDAWIGRRAPLERSLASETTTLLKVGHHALASLRQRLCAPRLFGTCQSWLLSPFRRTYLDWPPSIPWHAPWITPAARVQFLNSELSDSEFIPFIVL